MLTVALRPITDVRECRNYGGSGNASAFRDESWDLFYPLALLLWLSAVIVEQLIPVTWNGRAAGRIIARALLAVAVALTACCGAGVRLLALCH